MSRLKTKWVEDNAITQDKFRSDNDAYIKGRNAADNADVNIVKVNASDELELAAKINDPDSSAPSTDTQLANKKYVDDQVATISIPSVFELKGNWNATTNSPTLDNTDTSVDNFLYYVNVAGSVDFGAGSITFAVGDWVYNNGATWEKADNNDDVLSVNSQTGAVVLDSDDISEGSANFYYTEGRFDTSLSGKDTDDLSEGATNLYHTTARARTAAVDDTAYNEASWNGVTDQAPSKNAVRDEVEAIYTYVDAQVGSTQGREVITLDGTDISNGYIELAQPALANSVHCTPVGGPEQEPGTDFTESVVVTNTRITFAGDLAAEAASGDKLIFHYEY